MFGFQFLAFVLTIQAQLAAVVPAPAPAKRAPAPVVAQAPAQPKPAAPAPAPAPPAAAPTPAGPTADQVVAGVQSYYKTTNKLQSTFRQRYANVVTGKTSLSDGKLYIEKPGKMRWWYLKPDVKHYVSDGSTLWVIEEANKQAFKQSLHNDLLPVAVTFLYGQGDLAKDFTASLDPGKHGGKGDLVVKLVPKQPSAQYKTLWLVVDPADYHVKESVILEVSDNTNSFSFANIALNDKATNVKPSVFRVSEAELRKKGIKIIVPQQPAAPAQPPK